MTAISSAGDRNDFKADWEEIVFTLREVMYMI